MVLMMDMYVYGYECGCLACFCLGVRGWFYLRIDGWRICCCLLWIIAMVFGLLTIELSRS